MISTIVVELFVNKHSDNDCNIIYRRIMDFLTKYNSDMKIQGIIKINHSDDDNFHDCVLLSWINNDFSFDFNEMYNINLILRDYDLLAYYNRVIDHIDNPYSISSITLSFDEKCKLDDLPECSTIYAIRKCYKDNNKVNISKIIRFGYTKNLYEDLKNFDYDFENDKEIIFSTKLRNNKKSVYFITIVLA